ncbi:MAG: arylesterase [Pseudoxanthomonas suwonensis]|nr:arylesterase [Pseudoxanthomonas suwonensis]
MISPRWARAAWIQATRRLAATMLASMLLTGAALAEPARTIVVMGDSLSAGYGMAASESWPALLDTRLRADGWRVVNASVSGETSAGGKARILGELQRHRPRVVVIALGANDGLRGLPLSAMRTNLAWMTGAAHGAGARVMIAGMHMPPNLGPDYTAEFHASFAALARWFDTGYLPFLLEPVADERANFMDDNLHPLPQTQPAIRDHVLDALRPLLQ